MHAQSQSLSRSNHAACALRDDSFCIFGGEDEASRLTNTLSTYSIQSKQWTHYDPKQFDTIPTERAGHSMVEYNGSMYIFGGDAGPKKGRLNDLWKLNMNKCNQKDPFQAVNTLGEVPSKRMKHSAAIYESYMFVLGGCNDQNYQNEKEKKTDALYIINLNDPPLTWYKIPIPHLPQRIRHSMHVLNVTQTNNYFDLSLIVICGEDANAYLQNDIFILRCRTKLNVNANAEEEKQEANMAQNIMQCMVDPKHWNLSKIEGIPFGFAARFGHSSGVLSLDHTKQRDGAVWRDVIVFGGYAGEMSVLNDLWLLSIQMDMKNNTCKLKECKALAVKGEVPSPRHGQSLNILNNMLVFYGGINLMFQTFNDVKIVNINLKEWKSMKQAQVKQKGGGMSASQKQIAKQQLKSMGFGDDVIDNALSSAMNFDQALAKLLGYTSQK
eukprot:674256_1